MSILRSVLCAPVVCAAFGAPASNEFFEAKVRPVLANKCYSCHTASALGGLRLDSRDAMLKGGKSGPAIVPGKAGDSLLMRAVQQADAKLKMPMAGDKLAAQEIADLREWIDSGAAWPEAVAQRTTAGFSITPEQRAFWSLQPLRVADPPLVRNQAWPKTAIDRFILGRLEQKGIAPAPAADKRVLLRRAYYDLTGLPPTPEQIDAFVSDSSPDAFAKVVDRLLESKHYGERWGRHWLDVARYADGGGKDKRPVFLGYGMSRDGYVNTWRYRDWVIDAFNRDMPYDQFVKAQIAADLMPEKDREAMLPGLGFFGLGPWFTGDDVVFVEARANERDDKIDALTKGFLGLTVTCARCHDHKYDPISQKDYYALGGVFWSSGYHEYDLAPGDQVASYRAHWKKIKDQQAAIESFVNDCTMASAEDLARQTTRYMMAARRALAAPAKPDTKKIAEEEKIDPQTFTRWVKYLAEPEKRQHPYLKAWDAAMKGTDDREAERLAGEFQKLVLEIIRDKKAILTANEERVKTYLPDPNEATVELPGDLRQFEFFQYKQLLVQKVIETHKHYVWLDVVRGEASPDYPKRDAIFENPGKQLLRFLTAEQKAKLDSMQAELAALEKASLPEYPYLMGLSENAKPENLKVALRGNVENLGDEVPRGLPAILASEGSDPKPFAQGSGRLELAEAIMRHPLTARVIVNRIWLNHFGRGLVATPSNFGVMGERPSHPELLDYLAGRLIANKWSIKALHREIMLSAAYQLSARSNEAGQALDPGNVLLWRANFRRLEAEAIRDSMLFVSGALDERVGGEPLELNGASNKKRTVYARIRRSGGEGLLSLFDFPDPTLSGDQRAVTNVPLQGLFFLNSDLVWREAERFAKRLEGEAGDDAGRIERAYRLLYGRQASETEVRRGLAFLAGEKSDWKQYAQALLSSGEFLYLN
ncbi:MAG: PSD1 and planctomycete cytochrome C domain-containing protein [Bryobacteraceae bacterium]